MAYRTLEGSCRHYRVAKPVIGNCSILWADEARAPARSQTRDHDAAAAHDRACVRDAQVLDGLDAFSHAWTGARRHRDVPACAGLQLQAVDQAARGGKDDEGDATRRCLRALIATYRTLNQRARSAGSFLLTPIASPLGTADCSTEPVSTQPRPGADG